MTLFLYFAAVCIATVNSTPARIPAMPHVRSPSLRSVKIVAHHEPAAQRSSNILNRPGVRQALPHYDFQPELPELFDQLRKAGLTLSLDTNDDPNDTWDGVLDQLLDRIDVLLPNEDEILRIAKKPTLEESLDCLASRIPLIVVNCGARGAVVQQG
jgi:hypothetical protein